MQPWLQHCEAAWSLPRLADGVTIEISSRLHRSLGRCYPERRIIRLAPFLFAERADLLPEVVCHEVAHLAVFDAHRRGQRPHGAAWRELMRQAGYTPRVRVRLEPTDLEIAKERSRMRVLYEHRCPVCQMRRLFPRPIRRWRCRECVTDGLTGELTIRVMTVGGEGA